MRGSRATLALALLAAAVAGCGDRAPFQGTPLDPPRKALDFTLRDQFGGEIRLADLRGRVVVLTFLYTACPDLCPLVAQKLREVDHLLGDRRREVALVAVTVDPERDTPARAAEYSRQWGMLDRWRFLTGDRRALEPVWAYYWVGDVRQEPAVPGVAQAAAYGVTHASPLHLIDRAGRIRVVHGSDFRPAELAHDLELLLRQ